MSDLLIHLNLPAAMRDGTVLKANIFRPAADGRFPVLLTRTPYGKDFYRGEVIDPVRAARSGYVVVVQDCRGRFDSGGDFVPFIHEGPDGYDTVEWAAALPYSDGQVGMFGASYYGYTQWAAAMQQPPHLRAIAPFITWSDPSDGVRFRGGAVELGLQLFWGLGGFTESVRRKLASEGRRPEEMLEPIRRITAAIDRLSEDGYDELPLASLEWLREIQAHHLLRGIFRRGPGSARAEAEVVHERADLPTLTIGGWYDMFQQGSLDNYISMRALGRKAHLVMGPWAHLNRSSAVTEVEFGVAADTKSIDLATDLTGLQLRWFDHYLKGKENGVGAEQPVQVFVTGENGWRRLPDWPPPGAREEAFYLAPGGAGGQAPGGAGGQAPGRLTREAPARPATASYDYDPANPAPTIGGHVLMPGRFGSGARDQRPLSLRPDVLTFTSDPLTEPLTVMGRVRATLYASSSAPDTDFVVRLIDVHPDGFLQNLADGIVRARYRNSFTAPELLTPGEPAIFDIDLWSVAHQFRPGHRVAVQVTSSSYPRWDRNLNTAAEPGSGCEWQVARQTLLFGREQGSLIRLPVV